MQTDPPPSAASIWDWTAAVAAGAAELQSLAGPAVYDATSNSAYPFWLRQVKQWNDYNNAHPNNKVASPQDQQEGPSCRFTNPSAATNSSPYWFGDAILIKQYNGAPVNYIVWNGSQYPNAWSFSKANDVWPNYVHDVCNCMVQSACTHGAQ